MASEVYSVRVPSKVKEEFKKAITRNKTFIFKESSIIEGFMRFVIQETEKFSKLKDGETMPIRYVYQADKDGNITTLSGEFGRPTSLIRSKDGTLEVDINLSNGSYEEQLLDLYSDGALTKEEYFSLMKEKR
jgi:DNA polymerase III sliding clamp (beta) subunit (PCNA family)